MVSYHNLSRGFMSLLSAILGSAAVAGSAGAAAGSHMGVMGQLQRKALSSKDPWDLPAGKRLSPEQASRLSPSVRGALESAIARTPGDTHLPDIGVSTKNPHSYLFRPADNIVQLGSKKGTSLLTHELGHLEQLKRHPRSYKLTAATSKSLGPMAPAAALAAGGLAYITDQDVVNPGVAALAAGTLTALPSIALEGDAWRRGNKILEGHLRSSGRKMDRLRSLRTMAPWIATFAAASAAPAAVFGVSDLLRRKLRESDELHKGETDGPALQH